jgi:hypothetical protein
MKKKWVYYTAVTVFLAYTAVMIGPYVRSVIVRDASITTWSRTAVSPIAGQLVTPLPQVGTVVDADGVVATVRNRLLLEQNRVVENTRDRAIEAETRISEGSEYLAALKDLEAERVKVKERNVAAFHARLETEKASIARELEINRDRIAFLQEVAGGQQAQDAGSQASANDVLLRITELEARSAELEASLEFTTLRDQAAEQGVYITADGGTPNWVHYGQLELQLETSRAGHRLHAAKADLREAKRDLEIEQKTLAQLTEAEVKAPPGSLVFSLIVPPDATVAAGDGIIEWIDCSSLLVDVPVSDAEVPLIAPGTQAEVVLEGEPVTRTGTVFLTRGSSAVLGRNDLAAVAKGRTAGVAQVVLRLEADRSDFDRCPVGQAAYVNFPGIGLIDVLRARLRL